ncbi:MAG: serine/threonine protein kinase, partial [Rhodospirillales bacterium]|nr:serine/threonine protein kinase [Rhodospirillales bacterium]
MSDERPADAPPSDPRPPGDSQTLPAGYRLGRYEIRSVLGLGGFGTTYRAHDTRLHRDVAIKEYLPSGFSVRHPDGTVRPRSAQEAETFEWGRERFADEARTLARLERAAGIVNVHDIVEANGTAYMVMEFLRGETLEALLKRHGTLSQDGIERLLHPLLAGLESVHHADFLHRDIKPANILIDEAGTPKLIDFGASRMAVQGRTQAMTAIFTPGYAAPEQMALSGNQGPWSDIYALGATLHQCVSGVQPPSAIERMIEDRLAPASEIGRGRYAPGLLAAIDAALVLKPAGRPQSIAEWRGLIAGGLRPLAAAAAPVIAPAASTAAGSRWPAWVGAGIVALALAGGGIYAWRTMQDAA